MDFKKSQEKNPRTKSLETFANMFAISIKKKSIPALGSRMDLKIYRKSIALPMVFCSLWSEQHLAELPSEI
jgi:hypothetical protein